ncbi:ABC-three component system middle component 6 [Flavobacterium amniphilum]|uniref:ABC-three component system middle component 6 n=1 Tax=Flavobacterium amniphilum TaxID=1834035 RepID=UPI00374CCF97
MLLPQDVAPEKSLYVIGGRIIETFNSINRTVIDIKILYSSFVTKFRQEDLSFSYFLYALDWLFMIGFVEIYNNTKIKRCF